jgi:large subunit ribosomal protein L9
MASSINVILQQDLRTLGKAGDVVRVRPGYARNYLLPRAIAVLATERQMNRLEHEKVVLVARNKKLAEAAQALAAQIAAAPISIARKVGSENRLYGAVSGKEIEAALAAKNVTIDRHKLELPEAIRALGTYEIPIKLGFDVVAKVKLEVVAAN